MLRPAEQEALQDAPGALVALGDDGLIGFASRAAHDLLGWDSGLVGQPLSAIVPDRLQPPQKKGYQRFVATKGLRQEDGLHRHPARRRDGSEVPLQIKVVGFARPDGGMFLCAWLAHESAPSPGCEPVASRLAGRGYRRA